MTKQLKYSKDVYRDYEPFYNDDEINWKIEPTSKLVVVRKEHTCVDCRENLYVEVKDK
jgi:hypothetical protein